jgi:hypothetical protein
MSLKSYNVYTSGRQKCKVSNVHNFQEIYASLNIRKVKGKDTLIQGSKRLRFP